jgi:hypothetical protein
MSEKHNWVQVPTTETYESAFTKDGITKDVTVAKRIFTCTVCGASKEPDGKNEPCKPSE